MDENFKKGSGTEPSDKLSSEPVSEQAKKPDEKLSETPNMKSSQSSNPVSAKEATDKPTEPQPDKAEAPSKSTKPSLFDTLKISLTRRTKPDKPKIKTGETKAPDFSAPQTPKSPDKAPDKSLEDKKPLHVEIGDLKSAFDTGSRPAANADAKSPAIKAPANSAAEKAPTKPDTAPNPSSVSSTKENVQPPVAAPSATSPKQAAKPSEANSLALQDTQKQSLQQTDPYAPKIQPVAKKKEPKQKMSGQKKAIIAVSIVAAVIALAVALWFAIFKTMWIAANSDPVYVTSVGQLVGMDMGTNPRYAAVVEPQKTIDVNKDDTKTVATIHVQENDEVEEGTPLFSYDTQEMEHNLVEANIQLEGIANRISTLKSQITDLETQLNKASDADKPSYTLQINNAKLDVRTEEYNSSIKSAEIEKIQKDIDNADVLSTAAGVIKTVNATGQQTDPSTGQPLPFISILAKGDYRIRGSVSELNVHNLAAGQSVIVYSRVNPENSWRGTIDSIDLENPASNDSSMMMSYGSNNADNQSTKYNFYVKLEEYYGLMLGQHVYLEPDLSGNTNRVGVWLPAFYIAHSDKESYVWLQNPDTEKLMKSTVVLGDYDGENDLYQIISGVKASDYIAYPDESYLEGMPTVIERYSASGEYTPSFTSDEQMDPTDDGAMDGGFNDGSLTEGDSFDQNFEPEDNTGELDLNGEPDSSGDTPYGYYDDDGNWVTVDNSESGTDNPNSSDPDIYFYDEDE